MQNSIKVIVLSLLFSLIPLNRLAVQNQFNSIQIPYQPSPKDILPSESEYVTDTDRYITTKFLVPPRKE